MRVTLWVTFWIWREYGCSCQLHSTSSYTGCDNRSSWMNVWFIGRQKNIQQHTQVRTEHNTCPKNTSKLLICNRLIKCIQTEQFTNHWLLIIDYWLCLAPTITVKNIYKKKKKLIDSRTPTHAQKTYEYKKPTNVSKIGVTKCSYKTNVIASLRLNEFKLAALTTSNTFHVRQTLLAKL